MENIQVNSFRNLIVVSILSLIFIYFLFNYIFETDRYDKLYSIYNRPRRDTTVVSEEYIDISKSDAEYTYKVNHPLPASGYSFTISIPTLDALKRGDWKKGDWKKADELAKGLDFKLRVILKDGSKEVFNKIFANNKSSYTNFKVYPSKEGKSPILNLIIKVVKPEIKESLALAKLWVHDVPARFPRQDFLLFYMILVTILVLMVSLPSALTLKGSKSQLIVASCMTVVLSLLIIKKYLFGLHFLPDSDNRKPWEFIHFVNLAVVISDIGLLAFLIYLSIKNSLKILGIITSIIVGIMLLLIGGRFFMYFLCLICGGA